MQFFFSLESDFYAIVQNMFQLSYVVLQEQLKNQMA